MTFTTFKKAIKICKVNKWDSVIIGGGEPTLHPRFMDFLKYVVSALGDGMVGIITNGSNTTISLELATMHERGIIDAAISVDKYHVPVSPVVIQRFKELGQIKQLRGIVSQGRGKNISSAVTGCFGPYIHVYVQGDIYTCTCKTDLLGTVDAYKLPKIICGKLTLTVAEACQGFCSTLGPIVGDSIASLTAQYDLLTLAEELRDKKDKPRTLYWIISELPPAQYWKMYRNLSKKYDFRGLEPTGKTEVIDGPEKKYKIQLCTPDTRYDILRAADTTGIYRSMLNACDYSF